MRWFKKKPDPVSEKAKALEQEIEALQEQIRHLSEQAASPQPRFRSSTLPGGETPKTSPPEGDRGGRGPGLPHTILNRKRQ